LATTPILQETASSNDLTWRIVGIAERIVSALLLAALTPVIPIGIAAIALLSHRSPLIAHRRVGWRGTTLWMLKLRTMWGEPAEAARFSRWIEYIDDEAGPNQKHAADPRVSNAFARFCRRHSIDEIPQLWHVIRGEMSLVGPRPVTFGEIRRHYGAAAEEVLLVKPGIAGLWQVSGRNSLPFSDRLALDLHFVHNRSVPLYLRILLRTVPEVWCGTNAW
jgi:exopolysaccharide production protein ExoY